MFTKENLTASLANEFRIIKHLFTKIPEGKFDFKPTEKQRTTLELLQYMSIMVPAAVAVVAAGSSDAFHPFVERSKTVTSENFLALFAQGETEALAGIEAMTPEELAKEMNIFGMGPKSKGVYLVETSLKWITAYKMQLFLYIKASGNADIGTSNLWGGMDAQAK